MQGRRPLLPQLPADRGEIQPYVGVLWSLWEGSRSEPPTMLTAVANTVDNGMGVGLSLYDALISAEFYIVSFLY